MGGRFIIEKSPKISGCVIPLLCHFACNPVKLKMDLVLGVLDIAGH